LLARRDRLTSAVDGRSGAPLNDHGRKPAHGPDAILKEIPAALQRRRSMPATAIMAERPTNSNGPKRSIVIASADYARIVCPTAALDRVKLLSC
jgi:hypothetical protein